jgi:hypothetical protein
VRDTGFPEPVQRRVDDLETKAGIAISSISESHIEEMNDGDPHRRIVGDQP